MTHIGFQLRIVAALSLVLTLAACAQPVRSGMASSPRRGSSSGSRVVGNAICRAPNTVARDEIGKQNPIHLEEMFSRIPGVRVTYIRDGFSVQIRGTNTLIGSGEPLYVIDGMPYDGIRSSSVPVNPVDVECIEVLKDVGQTGLFGTRGANGVVLITTRRGG
jgi:TonB-dependent SusC/RagA subfamily outer membrane receptor